MEDMGHEHAPIRFRILAHPKEDGSMLGVGAWIGFPEFDAFFLVGDPEPGIDRGGTSRLRYARHVGPRQQNSRREESGEGGLAAE